MEQELNELDCPEYNKIFSIHQKEFDEIVLYNAWIDGYKHFFGEERILHGWYVKDDLRVRFYFKPTWYSRMKMYWFFGWKWEDKPNV
jgi:hypothetical protein